MQRYQHIFIFTLLSFMSTALSAINADSLQQALPLMPDDSTKVMALIDLCYFYDRNDASQIKTLAEEALILAKEVNYQTGVANSYFALGLYYDQTGEYDQSLQNYLKSIEISRQTNNLFNTASTYHSIGISYRKQNNNKEALYYYQKSLSINQQLNEHKSIASDYINIGNIYAAQAQRDSAIFYYNQAKKHYLLLDPNHPMPYLKLNLAIQYEEQGLTERANILYLEALEASQKANDLFNVIATIANLGYLETKRENYALAQQYFDKATQLAKTNNALHWLQTIYEGQFKLYEQQHLYKEALATSKKFMLVRDSLFNTERNKTVNILQEKFKAQQKENEILLLNQEKETQQQNKKLLLFTLFFIVIIAALLIQWQRWKRTKEKELATQKEVALAASMKALEYEQNKIKTELAYKEKELTTFALHLVQKNEFIEHIENALQEVSSTDSTERKKLREIIVKLRQNQLIGTEINQFHQRLDEIHQQFFLKLENSYPQLTKKEKQLAALLRLNLSTKEIATLNRVTEQAVKMSRHRMRKRLNIDSSINLNEFFKKIA